MFRIGTVVASYPEGNSVDVLLDRDGGRLSNVQVGVHTGSSATGILDLPDVGGPSPSDDARWDPTAQRSLYIKAVVGFVEGVPFVNNFLLPQVNQITFQQKNRRVTRHASDVYSTVDDAGNLEVAFPNGTYLRFGASPAHEDLTAQDYDKKWAIARNIDKALHFQLTIANGGVQKASLNIDPSGNITLTHVGNLTTHTQGTAIVTVDGDTTVHANANLTANVTGDASVTVGGTTAVNSSGNIDITAPLTTVHGPLTVTQLLTYQGGMAGSGTAPGGGSANITGSVKVNTGSVTVTSGDVTADGHTLKSHVHGGVQSGGSNTSTPTG